MVQMFHDYPTQREDFSYGLSLDGDSIRFFDNPTPGQSNGEGILGFVRDTTFSHKRGFYDRPFDLAIRTSTAEAEIYYTTDGSTPSSQNGTLYTGPIAISTTTTLRAIAVKNGYVPTKYRHPNILVPRRCNRDSLMPRLDFQPNGMGTQQITKWIQRW